MKRNFYLIIIMIGLTLASCSPSKEKNSLLAESKAPFGAPEFDKFQSADYLPAFEKGLKEQRDAIDAIVASKEEPTFENTIDALELSGETLARV